MTDHKECADCRQVKPVDDFYRHPHGRLGRAPICKPCHRRRRARVVACRQCGADFSASTSAVVYCSNGCVAGYNGPPVCVCDEPEPGWAGLECARCRRPYGPGLADVRAAWRARLRLGQEVPA